MQNRIPEPTKEELSGWAAFKQRMSSEPALITVRVNSKNVTTALLDTGCDCYAAINKDLVRRLRIPLVDRRERKLSGFSEGMSPPTTKGVAVFSMEIGGFEERIYAYVIPKLGHNIFLGKP